MDMDAQNSQLQDNIKNNNKPTIEELIKNSTKGFCIPPRWLTMVSSSGNCQICNNPEGATHTYTLNYKCNYGDDKNGFIVCGKTECNFYIKTYIKIIYYSLYITKKWQELLVKRANNSFVSVTRTNGTIEHDWILCSNENKTTSVYDVMMTLILCCQQKNIFIPSELFEYIYNYLIYSYNDDIHLIFNTTINSDNIMSMLPLIKCFNGENCKNIPFELL